MPRLISPFFQFRDKRGAVLRKGKVTFFTNVVGSTSKQDTYNNNAQTEQNTNPVILSDDGFIGNVFGSDDYSVLVEDKDGVSVFGGALLDISPVGGSSSGEAFEDWDSTVNYLALNSIVLAGDGNYYKAIQDNTNINPVTDTDSEFWVRVEFREFWSTFESYSAGELKIGSDGFQYESLVNSNQGNNPVGNNGAQWERQATNEWSTGRSYIAGDVRIADDGRWYKAVIDNSGNEPSADDGTNWLPSQGRVDDPSNVLPADAATDVSRSPTLTTSAFAVSGGSDEHEYTQYQLSEDGFTTIAYDSLLQPTDLESHLVPTLLDGATEYSYRVRHKGIFSGRSDWSTVTTFTTTFPLSTFFLNDLTTGNGTTRSLVSGIDLSSNAGLVMIANTATTDAMRIVDTGRGAGDALSVGVNSNSVSEPTGLTSFDASGYTVGALAAYNASGDDIYSLTIRKVAKFMDFVLYSGDGSSSRGIGHNLNSDVGCYLIEQYNGAAPTSSLYHTMWFDTFVANQYLSFGSSNAVNIFSGVFPILPTSSVFYVGSVDGVNGTGRSYLAILFANNPSGGVTTGAYNGTGVSGNEILTGFPTGTFLCKKTSGIGDWYLADIQIGTGNHINLNSTSELAAGGPIGFNSNGVTLNADSANEAGQSYVYLAIADPSQF